MITRGRAYMAEPVSGEMLKSVMEEYLRGSDRRRELRKAYENDRAILRRQRQEGMPNNRLAHGYPRYIVTMASGYLLGEPVAYQAAEGQEEALDRVLEAYDEADVQSVDAELAKDASIYGTGIEMIYADDEAKPQTAALDAESAFVVYDDTVENRPMLGVRFAEKRDISGTRTGWTVWAYTERAETRYTASELTGPYTQEEYRAHYFGGVPMVEYWNGEDEQGDFEGVMTLIDAYDTLESDRINDKEQFVDALLVLTGCRMETNENGETPGQQLRKEKLLYLPDSDAKAEYLCRSLTETDVEVLREALKTDIHKFSMVPEMTDQEFAGNASGVAMRYKLLGLEQLIRIKERWFREALRERMRLFAAFLSVKGAQALDVNKVTMRFFRSLPVNDLEIAQTVQAYNGLVPQEALLTQVPFIDDAQAAAEEMRQEQQERAKMQAAAFSVPLGDEEG